MRSLSHSERELPKCGKLVTKEGEGSDLSLSGSQVSLASRPLSVMGKASIRSLSVTGPRVRRPMSAVPAMSYTEISRDKRRPYSADSQLLLTSYQQKRNKLSACFSISADPMSPVHHDTETDGDIEFSSSTLISSQLSDQLGGAWMELEMQGLYLGRSAGAHNSSCTDNGSDLLCCSDVSEEHARSEKSLGERIQAMARDHVEHDRTPCPKQLHNGVDRKLEKYKCDGDPKKMSTQELHFRMVESGLISASSQHPKVAYLPKESDVSKFRSEYNCHLDINPEVSGLEQIADLHGRKELGLQENTSSVFWNSHLDFFQAASKSECIDQISFPKEHDVDSLEGGSSCNGLESPLREIGNSPSFSAGLDSSNHIEWLKSDLGPVRFQQWVNDGSKSNGIVENGGSVSSKYFSNIRSSHIQSDKKTVDLDCTVEEVSTDSEYSKLYDSSQRKPEKGPSHADCGVIPSVSKFESDSALRDNEKRHVETQEMMSSEPGCSQKDDHTFVDIKDGTMCDNSIAQEPNKLVTNYSNKMEKSEMWHCVSKDLQNKRAENLKHEENSVSKSSAVLKEDPGRKVTPKPTSPKGKKKCDPKKDHQTQVGTKRKNEGKLNGSGRRCGKSPPSHRTFIQPKEETLPGETQPELLSWMSMCSDDLGDQTKPICHQVKKDVCAEETSLESKDQDSPYNEIMTILRVLEEKEDESSLMRILNKQCELRTSYDTSTSDANPMPSSDGSSTPFSLLANENETESSRHVLQSAEIMDAPNKARASSELGGVAKLESFHNIQKPAAVPCTSEIGVPQPPAQGELRDLLTFLDAVDQSCSSVLEPRLPSNSRASPRPQSSSQDPHNLEELLLMGRSELAQEIVSLRLALEDRDATINLLRTALREQKDSQVRQNAAHKSELENQMRQIKAECEAVIKRHQKFIDQLIADKASLSKRCESLVQDSKEIEEKHAKAMTHLEERHKVETQRVKDITAATEKLKRERWVENKTQKIKELTVRGLEPELGRLTSQHEQEMAALRTVHAQELEQMEVRAARRAAQQMETLREQLVQEKEDALAREREMLRQRMEKQQFIFEEEGTEQRRRLVAEVRREQDRLATLESRLEVQFEERKRGLEREAEQERERVRRDYTDKLNEMHRKQQNEILQYREALKAEKESWIETYQQQQKQALIQTTNEIRDQLKRERDREIEVVIERLESEATISREEREKAAENRLRRVREQLTSELRDVESALNTLREKHAELRAQLQEKEDKLASSDALNRSMHTQLIETRKIADQLSAERADLKQTLQCELSNDMECIRQQLADQHARHEQQLQIVAEQSERERQTHQQELQQLFDRVKLAITKKEEVVKVAKAKQKAAEEQNSHLQALLDHRRKESLMS